MFAFYVPEFASIGGACCSIFLVVDADSRWGIELADIFQPYLNGAFAILCHIIPHRGVQSPSP